MKRSICLIVLSFLFALPAFAQETSPVEFNPTRLSANPIIRPDMMPQDDGPWSNNINYPCLIRVPAWIEKPLGKYYLYFSSHHGTYIRLAYADAVEGPWKIYQPGTLRLEQVEAVNDAKPGPGRHVASPDIWIDDEHKQIRMYFHFLLPALGHKSSVALSSDGLKFEPRAGAIAGPYLRVFRHDGAFFAVEDGGTIVRSPDGFEPFKTVSQAVKSAARSDHPLVQVRHSGLFITGDTLGVFFSRVGDAPEHILYTQLSMTGNPAEWTSSAPTTVLEPQCDYEGIAAPVKPSGPANQTNVRQLRDPFIYREGERAYLLYATAGETGIAIADIKLPPAK